MENILNSLSEQLHGTNLPLASDSNSGSKIISVFT